jgi:hypothetical protein
MIQRATLLALALAALAIAQPTRIPPAVIQPGPVIGIMVCLPPGTAATGYCVLAALDASIALDTSVSPPVLRAVVPAAPAAKPRIYGAELAVVGVTATALPAGASNVAVYLNGLRQKEGADYSLSGGILTPLWPWPPGSYVLVDYDQ